MSILLNVIAAAFFVATAVFLLAVFIGLMIDSRQGVEEREEERAIEKAHESVPVLTWEEATAHLSKIKPEVFEHSYDLQLLYLAREGALSQFEKNCKGFGTYEYEPILQGAFLWDDTPEGNDYWLSLCDGYNRFLKGEE